MTRIVVLGIDGLDADLLRVYGPLLPHVRRLMLESPFLELQSSFPPDTASAWASLYTGLNPANHGIIRDSALSKHHAPADFSDLKVPQGKTFWDIASHAGKRVCVVNPFLAYPAWSVNGVMLSLPSCGTGDKGFTMSVSPKGTSLPDIFPPLFSTPMVPVARQLKDFCQTLSALTLQQVTSGLELYEREPWDIFFLQLNALDHIQHFLWRYSDPGDITYPGRNEHAQHILEFYRLFDHVVGRFRRAMSKDSILLVVSGHGHGRRSVHCLNLNEWLRTEGLLKLRMRPMHMRMRMLNRRYLTGRAKHRSLELLSQRHLQEVVPHLPGSLPDLQSTHHAAYFIDQQTTMAQVALGAETSSFGGIILNQANIQHKGYLYHELRTSIMQRLMQLRLRGRPIVNWVKPREDVYQGTHLEQYPDILFELRSDFGVGGGLLVPLTTNNGTHQIISGDHRMQGVFLLGNMPNGLEIPDTIREPTVMDVAPTLLQLLTVDAPHCDGRTLFVPSPVKQLIR